MSSIFDVSTNGSFLTRTVRIAQKFLLRVTAGPANPDPRLRQSLQRKIRIVLVRGIQRVLGMVLIRRIEGTAEVILIGGSMGVTGIVEVGGIQWIFWIITGCGIVRIGWIVFVCRIEGIFIIGVKRIRTLRRGHGRDGASTRHWA